MVTLSSVPTRAESTHSSRPRPRRWHWGVVGLAVVLFSAYYGALALCQRDSFVSSLDLADVDQAMWNTVHGDLMRMTARPSMSSRLGFHLEPVLLVLAPLYAVAPSAATLVLVQVVALALVAVPLYLLAADVLRASPWALAFPLLYLLSPAAHNAALSYFHPVTLGVLPALAAVWAVCRGRTRTALLFAAVALLAREDYGLWLAALAVAGWARTRQLIWIAAGVAGVAWFLVATLIITPAFLHGEPSLFWERYFFWLEGPEAWRSQGFVAEKGRYLLHLLLIGGAGALLAPLWALPALPALALNLLANYPLPASLDSYYSALIAPLFLAAAAIGLGRCRPHLQKIGILLMLAGTLWVHGAEGRSPLVPGFRPPDCTNRRQALQTVMASLPPNARVSASETVASHASGREWLEIFPRCDQCDHFLIDLLQDRSLHPLEAQQHVFARLADGWGVVAGQDGFLLLRHGVPNTTIPANLSVFAVATEDPQYSVRAPFGDDWELQGYDVFWDRWSRPAVRLYWQVAQPVSDNWQPAALALDPAGQLLVTPDTHPPVALLWLPTTRWEPGQAYVVEMLPFDAPERVELVAGVGAPLVDAATRLPTSDGHDLLPLAILERRGRGWVVHQAQP
ncbi:MAG: DUF2079 domain-containing protein [Anaerolineae bacterium]|nr:DUF2079 domain-containing protein [Anaerolineae bacterium]